MRLMSGEELYPHRTFVAQILNRVQDIEVINLSAPDLMPPRMIRDMKMFAERGLHQA